MKKLILIALSVCVLSTLDVIGQCNSEAMSNQCIPKLAAGFNFLKSYKIEKHRLEGLKTFQPVTVKSIYSIPSKI